MNSETEAWPKVIPGVTYVRVMKKEIDESVRPPRERIVRLHQGVVIQDCGPFLRVYNDAKVDDGGDNSPETAQKYPISSPRVWCEQDAEATAYFASRTRPQYIPPQFR